jgi:hypothetical protein
MKRLKLARNGAMVMSSALLFAVGGASTAMAGAQCESLVKAGEAMVYFGKCYFYQKDVKGDECNAPGALVMKNARLKTEECFVMDADDASSYAADVVATRREMPPMAPLGTPGALARGEADGKGLKTDVSSGEGLKLNLNPTAPKGFELTTDIGLEVAAFLQNKLRDGGGNEASYGDYVLSLDVHAAYNLEGDQKLKQVFVDVSLVNRDAVLDYMERQNYHNQNRFRADGIVDRPTLLASIGAKFEVGESQEFIVRAGSMAVSGLAPLKGKPSSYYGTAPYGLIVRYDKGIKVDYRLKNRIGDIVKASLAIVDGDGIKGQHSVNPDDSRANSYPSAAYTLEVHPINLFSRFFDIGGALAQKVDLYVGSTGARGTTGSYDDNGDGEKRAQDDTYNYMGLKFNALGKWFEARVVDGKLTRNPIRKDGSLNGGGSHVTQVKNKMRSYEFSVSDINIFGCDSVLYANKYKFDNTTGVADGEFTIGAQVPVTQVKGWTLGATCRNVGFKGSDIAFEFGEWAPNNRGPNNLGQWSALMGDGSKGTRQISVWWKLRARVLEMGMPSK